MIFLSKQETNFEISDLLLDFQNTMAVYGVNVLTLCRVHGAFGV